MLAPGKTKKGVLIINAARGGLIDEDALAEAIRSATWVELALTYSLLNHPQLVTV